MSDMIDRDEAIALLLNAAKKVEADEADNRTWGGPDPRGVNAERLQLSKAADFRKMAEALRALPAVQVGVKPLEWRAQSHDCEVADTAFGAAAVQNESHALAPERFGWWMAGSDEDDSPSGYGSTIEAAKAAAQADYEARIRSALTAVPSPDVAGRTFYIDCEFDGHNGPLLSVAMVRQDGFSLHVRVDAAPSDPWVIANVMPIMDSHNAHMSVFSPLNGVGSVLRNFIGEPAAPIIVADSPVDIGRFCRAISTDQDGGWASTGYPMMTFQVANVDCYPTDLEGAVQHNAWWDAMALRAALAKLKGGAE